MMSSIITVLSSEDENDDEIQIIGEKRTEVKVVQADPTDGHAKDIKIDENSNGDLQPLNKSSVKRVAPTLLTTSVTISKVTRGSPPMSPIKIESVNGYHGVRHRSSSPHKPEVITLDDDCEEEQEIIQAKPEVPSEGSCRSSVILIDSEDSSEPDDCAEGSDNAEGPAGRKVKLEEDIDDICRISDESDEEPNHCSSDSEDGVAGSVSSKDMEGDQGEGSNLGETNEVMDESTPSSSCAKPSSPGPLSSSAGLPSSSPGPSSSSAGPSSSSVSAGTTSSSVSTGPSSASVSAGTTSSCVSAGPSSSSASAGPASYSASAGPSSSNSEPPTSRPRIEIDVSGPGNLTEKLLKQLISMIGEVGFSHENLTCVTKKIMKYYNNAMEDFTQSEEFIDRVKNLIMAIGELMNLPSTLDRLDAISTKIHEFLTVFKRGSSHLTSHLKKLHKTWEKLSKRIAIIETKEVESDDEYENPYVMLDRYRKRAVQVYDKICQLENKSNHADRQYKREFVYAQGVGPVAVQRAVEKFYNKTRKFPDFLDIYKLVKRVNEEQDLKLKPAQVHLIASQVFADFGKKLKIRRQYDDFSISRSYLPEDASDPAEYDPSLREKLDMNRANAKKEEDVLTEFVLKEAEMKESGDKAGHDEDDGDNTETETDREDEAKVTFVDSDEEIANLEKPPDQEEEPASKRGRVDSEEKSTLGSAKVDNEEEPPCKRAKSVDGASNGHKVDPTPEIAPTKDSYMNSCGLQPN